MIIALYYAAAIVAFVTACIGAWRDAGESDRKEKALENVNR